MTFFSVVLCKIDHGLSQGVIDCTLGDAGVAKYLINLMVDRQAQAKHEAHALHFLPVSPVVVSHGSDEMEVRFRMSMDKSEEGGVAAASAEAMVTKHLTATYSLEGPTIKWSHLLLAQSSTVLQCKLAEVCTT